MKSVKELLVQSKPKIIKRKKERDWSLRDHLRNSAMVRKPWVGKQKILCLSKWGER